MLKGHIYAENGGYLTQQPSFDMDHAYGFFEMDDLDDIKVMNDECFPSCEEDDLSAADKETTQILTPSIVEQLSLDNTKWECIFSTTVDGPSFGTFMRNVRGHARTIVVGKTQDGHIFGAYATDAWSGRGRAAGHSIDDGFFVRGAILLCQESANVTIGSAFVAWIFRVVYSRPRQEFDGHFAHIGSGF
jgi:hypothetical protein